MKYIKTKEDSTSCIMIAGNTNCLEAKTLNHIADYYRVVIISDNSDNVAPIKLSAKYSKRIKTYKEDLSSDNCKKIFQAFSPDTVWYFSGYTDGCDGLRDENKKLSALIHYCSEIGVQKLIFISSVSSLNYYFKDTVSGKVKIYLSETGFECSQLENLCRYSSTKNYLKYIILRAPYLYSKYNNTKNYLGSIFSRMEEIEPIVFPYDASGKIDFLSVRDLTELLMFITEETLDDAGTYTLTSDSGLTYQSFAELLKKCEPSTQASFSEGNPCVLELDEKNENKNIRKEYGFIPLDNIVENLNDFYKIYKQGLNKEVNFIEKLLERIPRLPQIALAVAETLVLFVIVQLLLPYTSDNTLFKYVDLRLFFVVILGVTYGMIPGMLAGLLMCFSLIHSYSQAGITIKMLFYNMDYWLPFAIYLMTGAITGYLVSAKDQKLKFAEDEAISLHNKYAFLNDVYMSVINNKEEYKRQILGYQDSFGKIFEAVHSLDSSVPEKIFMNSIETLENILDNHTIAIYTLDKYQRFGRLVACSRELLTYQPKSLYIEQISEVYEVIKNRETRKNINFKEELPAYAYGILDEGKVRIMICIYKASQMQMSLYYMNLFTIICHLIRFAFIRALRYQTVLEENKYFENTGILKPEFFISELKAQRNMADKGIASHVLLKLHSFNIVETDKKLGHLIRHTDSLGIGEDGKYYLLLRQIDAHVFRIIDQRLRDNGIEFSVVEGV